MGLHKHISEIWKQPKISIPARYRTERMAGWRRDPVFQRIEKPTRIDAARRVGYKAKQGIVVVRTRVRRGGLRKGKIHMKRKPSKAGIKKITMAKSIQRMAEERTTVDGLKEADANNDGHITKEELEMHLEFRRKELIDQDLQRDAIRKMAWFALIGLLIYPIGIAVTSFLGLNSAAQLIADIAPTYFASIAVLVSAFFGADALKKK